MLINGKKVNVKFTRRICNNFEQQTIKPVINRKTNDILPSLYLQNTMNCQMFYVHDIDCLIDILGEDEDSILETYEIEFDNDEEKLIYFKSILESCRDTFGKPLTLIDISEKSMKFIENNFKKAINSSMNYISTNGNSRYIVIIRVSQL